MMDSIVGGLAVSIGPLTFFGFCAFAVWMDYRKKKVEADTAHAERMKAIEMGFPPLDAEIQRAEAYASAAWAAGLIGLLVPITVMALTLIGTIVGLNWRQSGDDITVPLIVAWSIAGGIVIVTVCGSLHAIRRLPRPTAEAQPRPESPGKRSEPSSADFQRKPLEL
jgi:hypothetical protein